MLLTSDSSNKKHVIAERILDAGVPENLCNLIVSDLDDYQVLSLYSALSKNFVGYKVLLGQDPGEQDAWLNTGFNSIIRVGMDPDFELIPKGFGEFSEGYSETFTVQVPLRRHEIHVAYGLEKLVAESLEPGIWVFAQSDILSVFIAKDRQLVFANSFSFHDQTELLYFIVNAMNLCELKQEDVHLYLDFRAYKKFGLLEFLQPYFKSVSGMRVPFNNPDTELEELPYLLASNHLVSLCV